jgi:hypothetical protein
MRYIDVDLHWIYEGNRNLVANNEVARKLQHAGWELVSSPGPAYRFRRPVIDGAAFDKDVEMAERIVGECLAQGYFYAASGEPIGVAPKPGDSDERLVLAAAYGIVGQWVVMPVEPTDA